MGFIEDNPNIPPCKECLNLLGDIPPDGIANAVTQWFVTVSPPPFNNKISFMDKEPESQQRYISGKVKECVSYCQKQYKMKIYNYGIHYELNKSEELHAHIILTINLDQATKLYMIKFSKYMAKLIGRVHTPHKYSCDIVPVTDNIGCATYLNKENFLPPEHIKYRKPKEYFIQK